MNILLDTHILLWWLADDSKLPAQARRIPADPNQAIYASVVSLGEIFIKLGKGKIQVDPDDLIKEINASTFVILPIVVSHVLAVARLPAYHGDPFDRMLIAQAISEPLCLLTHDPRLPPYSELVMLV